MARGVRVRCPLVGLAVAAVLSAAGAALGQSADDTLRIYVAEINGRTGVYLGKGLVLTAAPAVGAMATHLRVRIAGSDVDAKVVKAGSPDDVDLSLLSVETARLPMSVQMRRVELCGNLSAIGQAVIIAGPESSTPSKIAAPILLPPNLRSKFLPISPDVGNAGNLGSGVFDAGRKCLLGIMSGNPSDSKNEANGASAEIPKHFVPVSKIRAFIPAWFRF